MLRYIAIDGPPGAGVSALARALADRTGAQLVTDPAPDNPFRDQYARNAARVAFQAQTHCLVARYQQQLELAQPDLFHPGGVVLDYVFARDALFAKVTLKLNVIDKLAAQMDEYFFSYDGGALLVINTEELDIVEKPEQLEELTEIIRKTRAGIHHVRPIAWKRAPDATRPDPIPGPGRRPTAAANQKERAE